MIEKSRKLKVAVVGASFSHSSDGRENFAIKAHLPALFAQPGRFDVVAVCTTREESAKETAEHFNIPGAFHSVDAMLSAMPDIDMVTVAVRPSRHFDVVMPLLKAGKHVYCEHPLGVNTAQARAMYLLAKEKGVSTGVGYQGHFYPGAIHMAQLIREGFIGKPLTLHVSYFVPNYIVPRPSHRQWLFQSEAGGHPGYRSGKSFERLLAMINSDMAEICTHMDVKVRERTNIETGGMLKGDQVDTSIYLVKMADGSSGTVQVSYSAWFGAGEHIEIYGTEGMLRLCSTVPLENWETANGETEPDRGGLKLFGARVDMKRFLANPTPPERLLGQFPEITVPLKPVTSLPDGHQSHVVAEAFASLYRAILTGVPHTPGFREAFKIHRILDASERAAASNGWATVDYT